MPPNACRLNGATSKEWLAQRDARFKADGDRFTALASDEGLREDADGAGMGTGPGGAGTGMGRESGERDSDAKK